MKAIVLCLLMSIGTGAAALRPYYSDPVITFSDSMDVASIFGTPLCTQSTGLTLSGFNITSYVISNDSLILTAVPDTSPIEPIPMSMITDIAMPLLLSDTQAVFNKAGVYHAFLRRNLIVIVDDAAATGIKPPFQALLPLGSFRIYPFFTTTPSSPIANDSFTLNLIVGQVLDGGCPPVFTDVSAVISDLDTGKIYLKYTESPIMTLMACVHVDPLPYGPQFSLPKIPASGSYTVIIEDSIIIGSVVVNNALIVNGSVTKMQNPLSMPPSIQFIPDAEVFAVPAPTCDWNASVTATETLRTITDIMGNYSLTLPDNGVDYQVTVNAKGYAEQTVYTANYPTLISLPPQKALSFELIPDAKTPAIDVVVYVKNGKAPVESAYVYLNAGRDRLLCYYLDDISGKSSIAKAQAVSQFSGYTGKNGCISFPGLSLSPYIDYTYNISRYSNGVNLYANGLTRFNVYVSPDTLVVVLSSTGVEKASGEIAENAGISVFPNPFNPSTEIRFNNPKGKAIVKVYDLNGRVVASFKDIAGSSVTWNASNRASGIYLVKVALGKKLLAKRVLLQK